jgi:hypothetical protein
LSSQSHLEEALVEGQRRVEIGHLEGDVVDADGADRHDPAS